MPPESSDSDGQQKPKRRGEQDQGWSDSSIRWIGVGFELAGAIGIMTLIGYGIDRWLDTQPWGLVVGASMGIIGGLYNLVKKAMQENR